MAVNRRGLEQHQEARAAAVAMARAKQGLERELEANLKQLRAILKESQRIADELEAVLQETRRPGDEAGRRVGAGEGDNHGGDGADGRTAGRATDSRTGGDGGNGQRDRR